MRDFVLAYVLLAAMLLSLLTVFFGILGARRGKIYLGDAPGHVRTDPALRGKANKVIIGGGACAAALYLPVVLWSFSFAFSNDSPTVIHALLLVPYSIVATAVLYYPWDRIKKMGPSVSSA